MYKMYFCTFVIRLNLCFTNTLHKLTYTLCNGCNTTNSSMSQCCTSDMSLNIEQHCESCVEYVLRKLIIYKSHTSPALNRSSAIRCFERGNVIEIRDRIIFDFYTCISQIPGTMHEKPLHIYNVMYVSTNNTRINKHTHHTLTPHPLLLVSRAGRSILTHSTLHPHLYQLIARLVDGHTCLKVDGHTCLSYPRNSEPGPQHDHHIGELDWENKREEERRGRERTTG